MFRVFICVKHQMDGVRMGEVIPGFAWADRGQKGHEVHGTAQEVWRLLSDWTRRAGHLPFLRFDPPDRKVLTSKMGKGVSRNPT